ncbi:hypothetical protein DZK27_09060 [Rhodobacteraceae bacterium 63075]|nr:hypothetical protein DZK27_09060 [Rhodobacteraceae bacterium 63075]
MISCVRPSSTLRVFACACFMAPISVGAEPHVTTGYNSYGYPRLIDMPVATSRPDGELAFTTSHFAGQLRNTMTFQLTPRLSGSFRYSILEQMRGSLDNLQTIYDRSFSLHYRLADENPNGFRPSIAIGLNDFLGTGVYSSEYVVASKTLTPRVRFTAGIGWGRLGTSGGFTNPLSIFGDSFRTRPSRDFGAGGQVEASGLFRGDAALFGGLEWQATDRLKFALEYSSDAYPREERREDFNLASQVNIGASGRVAKLVEI